MHPKPFLRSKCLDSSYHLRTPYSSAHNLRNTTLLTVLLQIVISGSLQHCRHAVKTVDSFEVGWGWLNGRMRLQLLHHTMHTQEGDVSWTALPPITHSPGQLSFEHRKSCSGNQ